MKEERISSIIETTLRDECRLCPRCIELFVRSKYLPAQNHMDIDGGTKETTSCPVCLNTLHEKFTKEIMDSIRTSFKPYGGFDTNVLSKDAPTIAIPIHIAIRAQCAMAALEVALCGSTSNDSSKNDSKEEDVLDIHTFKSTILRNEPCDIYAKIKDEMRYKLRQKLHEACTSKSYSCFGRKGTEIANDCPQISRMSTTLHKEESGYMDCHIIVHASPQSVELPPTKIMHLPTSTKKRDRKRFRGNDPTDKQGGDPRVNLDKRVKAELVALQMQMESDHDKVKDSLKASISLERSAVLNTLTSWNNKSYESKRKLGEWIREVAESSGVPTTIDAEVTEDTMAVAKERASCSIHVASWRRPFHLQGRYTKSKRDVSQTPFYVPYDKDRDGQKDKDGYPTKDGTERGGNGAQKHAMKRLGSTSVEEEICPLVSTLACGGISRLNNHVEQKGKGSNIVFGMTKFHASGREDMDVRMVLPLGAFDGEKSMLDYSEKSIKGYGSGRPFVLEVIDAFQMPGKDGLDETVRAINCIQSNTEIVSLGTSEGNGDWVEENERKHVQYGANPMGVGISGLDYCPSSSFRNLQSETEDKVKFYGCLCWSEKLIPDQKYLEGMLVKGGDEKKSIYPLEIKQSTPLRVLHRRAAAVRTRHVLSLQSHRIDDHWFRLSLSTSAGTYVKEFCHGDCGRTVPSISSLLGCKTDIVELDCEGIATS